VSSNKRGIQENSFDIVILLFSDFIFRGYFFFHSSVRIINIKAMFVTEIHFLGNYFLNFSVFIYH
jgi:hypothetical protein